MGGLFGGGQTISTSEPRVGAMRVQQSSYGAVLPIVLGRQRVAPNLLWYGDFTPIAHTSSQTSGGKGGSVTSTNTTYTYQTALLMALCEGQIAGIGSIWKGKIKLADTAIPDRTIHVVGERHAVPGSAPYQVTVNQAANFSANVQVKNLAGTVQANVSPSAPAAASEYSVAAGVYTFHSSAANATRLITYDALIPAHTETALSQTGMTLFAGSMTQSAWSYLSSKHPGEAINYPGIAYVAHGSYPLGSNPSLDNHTFEILGAHQFGGGIVDCDPADVLTELLTNTQYGAGFPAAMLGSMTVLSDYCVSGGLFISPALTQQKAANEWISSITDTLNVAPVTADGTLQFVPYADMAQIGNGRTWTPDLTPAYDLTDDDFLNKNQPVLVRPKPKTDAFNSVSIEFTDRVADYNVSVIEAKDQGDIGLYGLRKEAAVTAHFVCDAAVAANLAQTRLQRKLYIRNEYEFRLGWRYVRLLPMSIVTLTDAGMGLERFPVRIISVNEAADGELTVVAEEMPIGAVSPAMYSAQASAGYASNHNVAPGAINAPLIFEPPLALTGGANQLWAAVSGGADWGGCNVWASLDGATYQRVGQILGRARYGTLNASIASPSSDPDTNNNVVVDLNSDEQIMPASQADVDAFASLCWADGEVFAYRDASLAAARRYSLGYLRRGLYGTSGASHAAGAQFARLDQAIFKYASALIQVSSTVYLKFTSFNAYGMAEENLADVTAYTHTVSGGLPSGPANLALQLPFTGLGFTAQWTASPGAASYDVDVWVDGTLRHTIAATATQITYTLDDAIADGYVGRNVDLKVAALANGQYSGYSQISFNNPKPAAVTGITATSTTNSITPSWTACSDTDLMDYQVHISTTSGFTPGAGNLAYTGAATTCVLTGLPGATTHYLRICARDKWGGTTWNYSSEFTKATV